MQSTGVTTHTAEAKTCYQNLITDPSVLDRTIKDTVTDNHTRSVIQSAKANIESPEESYDIQLSKQNDSPPFSPEDNNVSTEISENGWDSSSTYSELNAKDHARETFSHIIKLKGEMNIKDEKPSETESNSSVDFSDSASHQQIIKSDDDEKCLSIITEESVDLDKTKGNLSLLEQAITIEAEQGHMFHSTYKELDMFLLEHLARERRQTKFIDVAGRQIYCNKSKRT